MKKLENNMLLYILVYGLTTAIMGLIIWPGFDFLICKFITKSTFTYSVQNHILQPAIYGMMMGIVFWFVKPKTKKEDK